MDVRIDKTRQNELAPEFLDLRLWANEFLRVGIGSHIDNPTLPDRKSLHGSVLCVFGVDLAIHQDEIGHNGTLSPSGGAQERAKRNQDEARSFNRNHSLPPALVVAKRLSSVATLHISGKVTATCARRRVPKSGSIPFSVGLTGISCD
jgi:hypothetical protein